MANVNNDDFTTIRTDKLVKVYGKRTVVNKVDVTVNRGEIVGLLGPNGAGKTTTFYMIVGLIQSTAGRVLYNDLDVTDYPMYKRARIGVGYLPQEPSAFRKLSVWNNLMAIAETLKMSSKQRKVHVGQHLEEMRLSHLSDQMAYTLSGGERRRLEISRALIPGPKFLLMDEPFSGVDPISVAEVQDIVRRLRERGYGILITDHNVRETLSVVDRAYLIHQGEVLAEGNADFLVSDPQSRKFYLGENFEM